MMNANRFTCYSWKELRMLLSKLVMEEKLIKNKHKVPIILTILIRLGIEKEIYEITPTKVNRNSGETIGYNIYTSEQAEINFKKVRMIGVLK